MKDDKLGVTREIDGGLEMVDVKMPCVITADLRYAGNYVIHIKICMVLFILYEQITFKVFLVIYFSA